MLQIMNYDLGLQCLTKMSRTFDPEICLCPVDCNSLKYNQEISSEQLYPLYSQTFGLLSNENNLLRTLEKNIQNAIKNGKVYEQKILKDNYDDIISSSSVVHFYFKESGIMKYSQEEVFGYTELVGMYINSKKIILHIIIPDFSSANLGGVLGLCTGFSLITAVELIYWFTVRILHDYCRRNKINPQRTNDEESQQSADNNESNQKNDCDCETLKTQMAKLEANNAEIKASNAEIRPVMLALFKANNAEIKASNAEIKANIAEIQASNVEIKASYAELQASNAEIKALLELFKDGTRLSNVSMK